MFFKSHGFPCYTILSVLLVLYHIIFLSRSYMLCLKIIEVEKIHLSVTKV